MGSLCRIVEPGGRIYPPGTVTTPTRAAGAPPADLAAAIGAGVRHGLREALTAVRVRDAVRDAMRAGPRPGSRPARAPAPALSPDERAARVHVLITHFERLAERHAGAPVRVVWQPDLRQIEGAVHWDSEAGAWVITAQTPTYRLLAATTPADLIRDRALSLALGFGAPTPAVAWSEELAALHAADQLRHVVSGIYAASGTGAGSFVRVTGDHPHAGEAALPFVPWSSTLEYLPGTGNVCYDRAEQRFVLADKMPAPETLDSVRFFVSVLRPPIVRLIDHPPTAREAEQAVDQEEARLRAMQEATLRLLLHELGHVRCGHVAKHEQAPRYVVDGRLDEARAATAIGQLDPRATPAYRAAFDRREAAADAWAAAELARWGIR